MKYHVWIISALQLAYVLIGSFFDSIFPNWLLLTMVLGLTLVADSLVGKWTLIKTLRRSSIYLTSLGLICLLMTGIVSLYLGYLLAIIGQIIAITCLLIPKSKKTRNLEIAAFGLTILILETLGLVIVPPQPVNIPILLMMALVSLLVFNAVVALSDRKTLVFGLVQFLILLAFFAAGVQVIHDAFEPQSVVTLINQSPWHFGVLFMALAHISHHFTDHQELEHG